MNGRPATIKTKRTLARGVIATAGVALVSAISAAPAHAVEPATQACLGESFSSLANPYFGAGVSSFARSVDARPGLGDGIQLLQAGVVPDQIVPNSCNG
jgi:hypothetical protein